MLDLGQDLGKVPKVSLAWGRKPSRGWLALGTLTSLLSAGSRGKTGFFYRTSGKMEDGNLGWGPSVLACWFAQTEAGQKTIVWYRRVSWL